MRLTASEREIQNAILELLRLEHIYAIRLNSGAVKVEARLIRFHSGGAGVVDIVAFVPWTHAHEPTGPRVLWLEVKSGAGKQSLHQHMFQHHVEGLGMYYLLAKSLDDVTAWLRAHR